MFEDGVLAFAGAVRSCSRVGRRRCCDGWLLGGELAWVGAYSPGPFPSLVVVEFVALVAFADLGDVAERLVSGVS
jgi:hypothetical protein